MILPTSYFGNIEYFFQLWKEKEVIIDIHEPYQKQTFRTRCEIAGANGLQTLSIPVERPNGKDTLVKDVLVSYKEDWRKDHLKAIESTYSRTPYFIYYFDTINEILTEDEPHLIQLNYKLLSYLVDKIGLTVNLSFSSAQSPLEETDLRMDFTSKKKNRFNAHRYIQTFEERHGFLNNLSILDLLFNEGPNAISILQESNYSSL